MVAKPDDKWGETPLAYVELKPDANVKAADLVAHCRELLAGYKVPRDIRFEPIPKTSTGKIQKFELRSRLKSSTQLETVFMNPSSTPLVLVERDSRNVVTLTLNRPESFNALSKGLLSAFQQALDDLASDDQVRVVILAAAGKAFCAGHDLKEMRASPSLDYYQTLFEQCSRVMLALQRLPVPVIARVHGMATAAGCQLVAMCDLAVASSTARFAVSGVNLGLFCATPSVALSRNLGRKEAFEMLVTGAFIDAQQALTKGLINRSRRACRS